MESEVCPSFKAALDAGEPVRIDANQDQTLAGGKSNTQDVINNPLSVEALLITKHLLTLHFAKVLLHQFEPFYNPGQ